MNILTIILEKELKATKDRLEKLIQMQAPEIIIRNLTAQVAEMENGEIKIGGDNALLDLAFESYEVKTGNGGKKYIQFDNGVRYFPNAKYGRFITR